MSISAEKYIKVKTIAEANTAFDFFEKEGFQGSFSVSDVYSALELGCIGAHDGIVVYSSEQAMLNERMTAIDSVLLGYVMKDIKTAPKTGEHFLAYGTYCHDRTEGEIGFCEVSWLDDFDDWYTITNDPFDPVAWMPLPDIGEFKI